MKPDVYIYWFCFRWTVYWN